MKTALTLAATLLALAPAVAPAQQSTYSGQEMREIKALSAEETKQYLSGAGMGFALAAELNRYPGPTHVLDLTEQLALSPEQQAATTRLMNAHKAEAREIGKRLVEAELTLDRQFASGNVDEAELAGQVRTVAALHGEYRLSHLETHRKLRNILTADQVERYVRLRGYVGGNQGHDGRQQHGKYQP
jgi:Spy/CpxP family protein refolding chaperone